MFKRNSPTNTISDSDRIILNFAISKVESEIKNEINWKEIPQGLEWEMAFSPSLIMFQLAPVFRSVLEAEAVTLAGFSKEMPNQE